MRKLLKKLIAPLLVLLISLTGSAFFRLASERLPDYSGEVFPGELEEGIQNVFHLDENDQVVLYPWNLSLEGVVSLQSLLNTYHYSEDLLTDPLSWSIALFGPESHYDFYREDSLPLCLCTYYTLMDIIHPARTAAQEHLASLYLPEYIYFSEKERMVLVDEVMTASEGSDSLGLALTQKGVLYFHETFGSPPPEKETRSPEDLLPAYVEMTRKHLSTPNASPLPPPDTAEVIPDASSASELPSESSSSTPASEASALSGDPLFNPLLYYLENTVRNLSFGTPDFLVISNDLICTRMESLILSGSYSTLSQGDETLLAFSDSLGNVVVFFYLTEYGRFTGYSAHFADL